MGSHFFDALPAVFIRRLRCDDLDFDFGKFLGKQGFELFAKIDGCLYVAAEDNGIVAFIEPFLRDHTGSFELVIELRASESGEFLFKVAHAALLGVRPAGALHDFDGREIRFMPLGVVMNWLGSVLVLDRFFAQLGSSGTEHSNSCRWAGHDPTKKSQSGPVVNSFLPVWCGIASYEIAGKIENFIKEGAVCLGKIVIELA